MEQEDQATPIIGEIQVTGYRCRCGHEWAPKNLIEGERPRVCPEVQERQLGSSVQVQAHQQLGVLRAKEEGMKYFGVWNTPSGSFSGSDD